MTYVAGQVEVTDSLGVQSWVYSSAPEGGDGTASWTWSVSDSDGPAGVASTADAPADWGTDGVDANAAIVDFPATMT